MNKNILKGEWNKIKGKIQEEWADITDNDLLKIKADGQQLYGIVQEKYGFTKDEAEEKVNDFLENFSSSNNNLAEEIAELKNNLSGMFGYFSQLISSFGKKIPEQLHDKQEKVEHSIETHLWPTLAIVAAVGFLLGFSCSHKGK